MGWKSYKSAEDFSPNLRTSGVGGEVFAASTGIEVLFAKSNLTLFGDI
jgi:hypothetical protein